MPRLFGSLGCRYWRTGTRLAAVRFAHFGEFAQVELAGSEWIQLRRPYALLGVLMFETLEQLPPDPILGLSAEFKADPNQTR